MINSFIMEQKKHNTLRIVNELEAMRQARGWTQEELAAKACVSRMTVSRVESGFDPRLSTVWDLTRALGLELVLVPRELTREVQGFIQSGGRIVGQPPGVDAPKSIVDLLR